MNDSHRERRPLSRLAVASFLFGLASPLLQALAGVPALILGVLGLRRVLASDGRIRGRDLSVIGIVLGIVGIGINLFGFVTVVLNALQAVSLRTDCTNNLRAIGLAVNQYADVGTKGYLPPGTLPSEVLPPERRFSWQAGILQYLDAGPDGRYAKLYGQLDLGQAWDADPNKPIVQTNVYRFLCRGEPGFDPRETPGYTTYVGFAGVGLKAASEPRGAPGIGVFGYDRLITRGDVKDGTSNTLMATETTLELGHWAAGGKPTVRAVDPDGGPWIGPGRPFGGLHPGGTTAVYVDASVRFIAPGIAPAAFLGQVSIDGP